MIYFRSLEHQFLHKQLAVLIVCDLNCKKSCYVAHNFNGSFRGLPNELTFVFNQERESRSHIYKLHKVSIRTKLFKINCT